MSNLLLLERIYPDRRAELKRIILNEALQCFLTHGIETTQIEMIRARAETSVGAIYHHFKNKEGIVRALYLTALEDQAQRRERALNDAASLAQAIEAIIASYIDWVVEFPDFARFLYMSGTAVARSEDSVQLQQKNQQRNQDFILRIQKFNDAVNIQNIPYELLFSLVIGATESYCRAWLSHKVKTSPLQYKQALSKAAWRTIAEYGEA